MNFRHERVGRLRTIAGASAAMLIGATLAACAPPGGGEGAEDQDHYTLGLLLSLTGASANLGQNERDGAEMAVKEINEAGGINGKELRLTVEDTKEDPNAAVTGFNRLADNEEVLAVFGDTFGSGTLAIRPLAEREGVPLLAPNTTLEVTHGADLEYTFRVAPPANIEVDATVELVKSMGLERLGLLYSTDAYGSQAAELLKEAGLNIAAEESFEASATDLTAQLTKIRGANPDGILLWDHAPATGIGVRNAGQLGIDVPIFSGQASNNPGNLEAIGDSSAAKNWYVQGVIDGDNPLPRQQGGIEAFEATGHDYDPDIFLAIGYDGVKLFAEALKNAETENPSREDVKDGLLEVDGFESMGGIYSYSGDYRDGVGPESIVWLGAENGEFVARPELTTDGK